MDNVDKAEQVMKKLQAERAMPTTSQLRKFLTAVNMVSGKVNRLEDEKGGKLAEMPSGIAAEVKYLKVKLAYQIGKAEDGKKLQGFEKNAELMARIDSIGRDVHKYEEFAKYVEALIAYHKFYENGGRD
jgi:CRISPR-associated protein Csm2